MHRREKVMFWVCQASLCVSCAFLAQSLRERQTRPEQPYRTLHRCSQVGKLGACACVRMCKSSAQGRPTQVGGELTRTLAPHRPSTGEARLLEAPRDGARLLSSLSGTLTPATSSGSCPVVPGKTSVLLSLGPRRPFFPGDRTELRRATSPNEWELRSGSSDAIALGEPPSSMPAATLTTEGHPHPCTLNPLWGCGASAF